MITNGHVFKLLQIVITAHSSSVTNVLSPILFGFLCPVNIPRAQFSIQSNKFLPTFFPQKIPVCSPLHTLHQTGRKTRVGFGCESTCSAHVGFGRKGKHRTTLVSDDLTDIKTNALNGITALIYLKSVVRLRSGKGAISFGDLTKMAITDNSQILLSM